MRHSILPITAVSALALLAACGSKEPPATVADATAPVESVAPPVPAPAETVAEPAPAPAPAVVKPKPSKPAATAVAPKPAAPTPPPAPVVRTITVPAGTVLELSIGTALTSKTAKVGDTFTAQLTNPVVINGETVIASGTNVAGEVIKVVSGSDKIGGVPALVLSFDSLQMPGGKNIPVSGEITQEGKSDTAGDTAKIVGGTAAGAILGHQVKGGDKGKVIGGLLGAAVGALAAQKTGTEARIKEGTPLQLVLFAPVDIVK
ncbi:MAG: glycine zipper 2TM domain-containing protein [Steroidobacteraceae bacterium]